MTREINFGGVHTFDTRAVHKIRVQMTLPLSRFFYGFFFFFPRAVCMWLGTLRVSVSSFVPHFFRFFLFTSDRHAPGTQT